MKTLMQVTVSMMALSGWVGVAYAEGDAMGGNPGVVQQDTQQIKEVNKEIKDLRAKKKELKKKRRLDRRTKRQEKRESKTQ